MSIRKVTQKLLAPVIIVLVVAMTVGVFYISPMMTKDNGGYKGPAARLNGEKIKDADFNSVMFSVSQQAMQMAQYGIAYTDAQIRDQALDSAIGDLAFKQEMKKEGSKINVSGAEVDKFIKDRWPTEEELQSAMQQYGQADKGQFKKWIADQLKVRNFYVYKARQLKMKVSKADVDSYLEKISVSHILVGFKDQAGKTIRTDAAALQQANQIYEKATNGGDFAQLAKENSDDPGSKEKGGALGEMPLSQFKSGMVPEFVAGALALKAGQISKPVKTEYGYHIIKLNSLGMPKGAEYKTQYKEAEDTLLFQMTQDQTSAFAKWMQNVYQKASSNMEILDPGLRAYRLKQQQKWEPAAQAYEKALGRGYYKQQLDMYIDASDVYLQLSKPKEAIKVLKRTPAELRDNVDYAIAMAKAYKTDSFPKKAAKLLTDFSNGHADDIQVHQKLKSIFTDWKLTEAAAKEDVIINNLTKQEQANLQQYQQNLDQKNTTGTIAEPSASPAPASDSTK